MSIESFEVDNVYDGERLDKFLAVIYPAQSRTFFQKLMDKLVENNILRIFQSGFKEITYIE